MIFIRAGVLSALITTNPALLIVWLVFLTINIGFLINLRISAWIIYAVILLFTGGIIVLFTYIITLVFSIKVTFSNLTTIVIFIWGVLLIFSINFSITPSQEILISNIYLNSRIRVLAFMGRYLLLVLLAVVSLAVSQKGPLKSFFKNES